MSNEIECRKSGTWADSDGETGGQYAVFTAAQVESVFGYPPAQLTEEDRETLARDLTGWDRFYCGPGRAFGHEPSARIYKHAVLVYQRTGLDI